MDSKVFVLLIIALVFGFGFLNRRFGATADEQKKTAGKTDDMQKEIEDLRSRVETLEKIATDKGARLREEIDAL